MGDSRGRSARLVAKRAAKSTSLTPSAPQEGSDTGCAPDGHGSDADIVITPPPKIPSKRARSASSVDDNSDDSAAGKNKKKPKNVKKKAPESVALDPDRKLVLMIPQASNAGTQRENLKHSTPFDDALAVIYETIGCADFAKKPTLSYKLSNATVKAPAINLTSETDWEGCLEEVADAELKKKVKISYMASLRAKLKLNSVGVPQKGKKARKMPILDLEHASSGDDDFDDGVGIMEKESKFLEQLQNHHGRCQLCGPSKACKIDRAANHHNLTNNQLRGWARSLAAGTHNVTLSQPPRDELFGMFHKNTVNTPSAGPQAAFPGMPYMGMPPYFMPPWAFPGSPATPTPRPSHTSLASMSTSTAAFPSSNPPDMGALNPYTEIPEFIKQLHEYHPQRRLSDYVDRFGDLDFYNIDEVAKLGSADALVNLIGITHGNAAFLLGKIKDEMKRIDRTVKG
ncbi:hypothetical protein K438DRAFT_1765993 [Mycena galopus ATCC 62051]|nr:hypothetical protein K438DRAFT_1765993 [Mycena galopus ATCC 62051]